MLAIAPEPERRTALAKATMLNATRSSRYASLSLQEVVNLCAGPSDHEAWEEFVSRVGKPLKLAVQRTAVMWGSVSAALVEDLVQATYLKLWEGGRYLLQEFAAQYPEGILSYLKRTAANVTHDHFRHRQSQSCGGAQPHVSTADVDPEEEAEAHGGQESITQEVFLREIDEHLRRCLSGPDQERDRMIFWLYFRQGMTSREIASLPGVGLGTKGVGSVIERLKRSIREQIAGPEHLPADESPRKAIVLQTTF